MENLDWNHHEHVSGSCPHVCGTLNVFATSLAMVMHHHEYDCLAKTFSCSVKVMGGLHNQNIP